MSIQDFLGNQLTARNAKLLNAKLMNFFTEDKPAAARVICFLVYLAVAIIAR
jgi:hypothetical protein